MNTAVKTNHIGKKVSRIRELRGVKQESLAIELGISQQMVSKIEQSETLEDELLEKVAKALGVSSEGIRNFSEEAVFNYFNNFHDNSGTGAYSTNPVFNFNPLDKFLEAIEENKKLQEETKQLYERLCASEREKNDLLISTNKTLQDMFSALKK